MTKISTKSLQTIKNMKAKNKSYKTITRHLKVNKNILTIVVKQIESFEPKVRKLGSGSPKQIPKNMGKSFKQFVLKNKSLGLRKLAPKMVDKFNVKVSSNG